MTAQNPQVGMNPSQNVPVNTALARRLNLNQAIMLGLGSMMGAGIFAAFIPATQAAGAWMLLGLAIAAFVAFCNATSSAQLAAQYPVAGGTYVYGRKQLGQWLGFLAGWGFVIGKTASCAAMALVVVSYLAPANWEKPLAIALVIVLTGINYLGVTRTAKAAMWIVTFTLLVLTLVVLAGFETDFNGSASRGFAVLDWSVPNGLYGVLQSAGLLFFAFAGYARIATMGEEVINPRVNIPKAIMRTLSITLAVYILVASAALLALGADGLASSKAPLLEVVQGANWASSLGFLVQLGAGVAAAGALMALIAGIGRTALAMARENDLPGWLAVTHPKYQVPHRAEVLLCLVVCITIAFVDLRGAVGFSSFGVLLYYLVANISAFTQNKTYRRYPKALQVLGAAACLILVITLPLEAVLLGGLVMLVGIGYRLIRLHMRG